MADDLDVVQHPVLGPLKFPKDMPFEERNSLIQDAVTAHNATHAPSSNPAAQPGAFQTTRGGKVFNANKPADDPVNIENGGAVAHRLLLTGANKVGDWMARTDAKNLSDAAATGKDNPGIVWSTYGPRMLRSILETGANLTTPSGAATAAGVALANTNPVTGALVDSALTAHGGYGVYKHRQALLDLATTGQAKPDELEAGLNSGAEAAGGAAGALGQVKAATAIPIEQQNAAAQKALDPGWGKRGAVDANGKPVSSGFQRNLQGARAYLGGKGVQNVSDLQAQVPGAKAEIWKPAQDQFKRWGEESVQGPDGPTTYNKLEARRQEISAQLDGILSKDPAAVQTVFQQGKNPAMLADEQGAIEGILDEKMRQNGVNFPVVRNTYGSVKGIGNEISGTNTLSETPKRYGLGRMAQDLSLNPAKTVRGIVQGSQDIAAGRPVWSGKPTDVGVKEGFQTGGPKPSFETTTYPKPIGPETMPPIPPPYVPPPPQEQVPTTGPGGNVALFPDIPSGQGPSGAGEFPNWPPKVPDWSAVNTTPPVPPAESTIPQETPYGPPNTQGPPPLPPGVTPEQWNAMPTAMRNRFGFKPPAPGSYSPGAATEVTPKGGPLPFSTPPISTVPSTQPPVLPSSGAPSPAAPAAPVASTLTTGESQVPPTMPPINRRNGSIGYNGPERRTLLSGVTTQYDLPTPGEQLAQQVRTASAGTPSSFTEGDAMRRIMSNPDNYARFKAADPKTQGQMLIAAKNSAGAQ